MSGIRPREFGIMGDKENPSLAEEGLVADAVTAVDTGVEGLDVRGSSVDGVEEPFICFKTFSASCLAFSSRFGTASGGYVIY